MFAQKRDFPWRAVDEADIAQIAEPEKATMLRALRTMITVAGEEDVLGKLGGLRPVGGEVDEGQGPLGGFHVTFENDRTRVGRKVGRDEATGSVAEEERRIFFGDGGAGVGGFCGRWWGRFGGGIFGLALNEYLSGFSHVPRARDRRPGSA